MDWQACLDEIHATLGTRDLERVERAVRAHGEGTPPEIVDKMQRPTVLQIRGLTAKPWHDRKDFSWVPAFEAATDGVLAEFLALETAREGPIDYMSGYGGGDDEGGWRAWMLHGDGRYVAESTARCPVTADLLRQTRISPGDAMFSEFLPGTIIPLHCGGSNAVLSCHLPLIIPSDCAIRVGTQTRGWQKGHVVMFDDSYLHLAWNESDKRRVVLVFEVYHPELTDLETRAIDIFYDHTARGDDAVA
ncbi:MAG: aspartyl/asparaginyl beta-hydroxylase domain-containing protein [Myxococcales bacterium]|nr:aspartyl/asparaginyl beta-hydroxylase domain-containing protein [Myxococcales bacterium]MCB9736967.1 aspartyl/asparaginyl beta-hydroxylase domain-containing protein [Deltaproteobacteria bacterium]